MENSKIKISILPNYFLNDDGTFNKDEAIRLSGKIAGVCYDKEGYSHLENEPEEKTMRRVNMTLNNGHHSVYDHVTISFNIENIPKILAMVLNNEKQYTTSEKSARYTPVVRQDDSIITIDEERLYNKWIDIFKIKIKSRYGDIYSDSKIQKLAQENARYLVTVFMPTQMIYTTSLRQINYLASYMEEYIMTHDSNDYFSNLLAQSMSEFLNELEKNNVLVDGLLSNDKYRRLSLFGDNLESKSEIFSDIYQTNYLTSFASLAQAQRHRTISYQMERLNLKKYFIPPILEGDISLVCEWINDISSLENIVPQGELVRVCETSTYDNFILKCKERLCSSAQLEIMMQTRETLLKYKKSLEEENNPLAQDILKYSHGARCTFKDFDCNCDCKFKEGKTLTRRI